MSSNSSPYNSPDELRPFQRVHPEETHKHISRRKRTVLIVCLAVVAVIGLSVGLDAGLNAGKIHRGVSVEGVDLSGLTQEQATDTLQAAIDGRLAASAVTCVPNEVAYARTVAAINAAGGVDLTSSDDTDTTTQTGEYTDPYGLSWTVTAAGVGATFDATEYAAEAYAIGRPTDWSGDFLGSLATWISERWTATTRGIDLTADLVYADGNLKALTDNLDSYIGIAMINSSVSVTDGVVSVSSGNDGDVVDTASLQALLTEAFLGQDSGQLTIPMVTESIEIDDDEANAVAQTVQAAIADPVTVTYNDQSWTVDSTMLGNWTTFAVTGSGDSAVLVPSINTTKATEGLISLMGDIAYGNAKNASFDVSSGTPVIVASQTGEGPDVKTAASSIQTILYGSGGSRTITIGDATVQPDITTADAQNMGITGLIASYTLWYGSNGGTNREKNIELALRMLNGQILAPGYEWSWVVDMGACDSAEGFLAAGAIGEGGTSINEAGGGICNVATGLFNAVYEAGMEVTERHNHTELLSHYPLGRDCTVSYPSTTFSFVNDYKSYVLITATYDGTNMVISFWGTPEGRTVESVTNQVDSRTVYNYRTVRDASGNVLYKDTFYSYFEDD